MILSHFSTVAHPKVRSSKAVRGRYVVGCLGGVGVVGINVSQQSTHYCRHTWAHVLRWQASKVAANEGQMLANTADFIERYSRCIKTQNGADKCEFRFFFKNYILGSDLQNCNIRHSLVDGLHAITHSKLVYNLLRSLLKVNLPCIVPFSIRDFNHTIILDICHIVEEVLQRGNRKSYRGNWRKVGKCFIVQRRSRFQLLYLFISKWLCHKNRH